jgi:glycosyltransferase involved in cell wall biosynthesis
MHDHPTAAPATAPLGAPPSLSVVVPVYNEEEVLPEFHRRLAAVLDGLAVPSEIVYVNDGSRDRTMALLAALHDADPRVAVVDLSRNFGKEVAMSAGLDHASGDAVVVIDADLQDPPELIPEMLRVRDEGYDVVLMRRRTRANESWFKKATARAFYRAIGRIGTIEIPENVGDFRLLSSRAVAALRRFPERSRFMKGLFAWIGFPCKEIEYDRDGRFAGETKWNYWRLWNFALEGITSFSVLPLKIASYMGFIVALLAFLRGGYFTVKTMVYGDPVAGFPTLVVLILFLGGLQLMALGIIGEYLARMFVEVKQRPLYLVQRRLAPSRPIAAPAAPPDSAEAPWAGSRR